MSFDTRKYCRDNGIVSWSCGIIWDEAQKKKVPSMPAGYTKLTTENFHTKHDPNQPGFCIATSVNGIVVIDLDLTKAEKNETPIEPEIIALLDEHSGAVVKTPNGRHFYFKATEAQREHLPYGGTDIKWNGKKHKFIDCPNQVFAPPTSYTKGDTLMRYEWLDGNLATVEFELPEVLFNLIKNQPKQTKNVTKAKEEAQADTGLVKDILVGLNQQRFVDYDSWLTIGRILYNEKIAAGITLWDELSASKSPSNYQNGACAEKWATFQPSPGDVKPLTIGTLYYWLKEDNPVLYESLRMSSKTMAQLLKEPSHQHYAEAFYIKEHDQYRYVPEIGWYVLLANNLWQFQGKMPDGFMNKFSKVIGKEIHHLLAENNASLASGELSDADATRLRSQNESLLKGSGCVQGSSFVKGCFDFIRGCFLDRAGESKMDSNVNLLGFDDGVYDLSIGEFRAAKPEDYVATSVGYKFPGDTPPEGEGWDIVDKFLDSLFENGETRSYLTKVLARALSGNIDLQEFYMLTGNGGNGKGLLIGLLKSALGQGYCRTLPVSYFTKPTENKGAALPELAACKSARVVYATEPDASQKETIQASFLKAITGADAINCRTLFSAGSTWVPQFTVYLLCNDVKFNKVDVAIERRLRMIHFPFEFKNPEKYNPDVENHRLLNRNLDEQLRRPDVRNAFMRCLLAYYKGVFIEGGEKEITSPPAVVEVIQAFLDEQNPIKRFIDEKYEKAEAGRVWNSDLVAHFNEGRPHQLSSREVGVFMSLAGYQSTKYQGVMTYKGLRLKEGQTAITDS